MGAGCGSDSTENQVADMEISLLHVPVMIVPELLFVSGMLEGSREAMLLSRVEVSSLSSLDLALVGVLGVRSTEGNILRIASEP